MADSMATTTPLVNRFAGVMLLLTLTMALLKLAGKLPVAAWSWWAITAPLWAPWLLALACGILVVAIRLLLQTVRR